MAKNALKAKDLAKHAIVDLFYKANQEWDMVSGDIFPEKEQRLEGIREQLADILTEWRDDNDSRRYGWDLPTVFEPLSPTEWSEVLTALAEWEQLAGPRKLARDLRTFLSTTYEIQFGPNGEMRI